MAKTRKVTVDGDEFEVELEKIDGVWQVKVGGKEFTISVEGKSVEETTGKNRKNSGQAYKPMDTQTKEELVKHFAPFNARLSKLLHRDLSHWDRI